MKAFLNLDASTAVAVALAGCDGASRHTAEPDPFAYDVSAPLHYTDRGVLNRNYPIEIHDVSFTTAGGRRVDGLLAVPPAKGRSPASSTCTGRAATARSLSCRRPGWPRGVSSP